MLLLPRTLPLLSVGAIRSMGNVDRTIGKMFSYSVEMMWPLPRREEARFPELLRDPYSLSLTRDARASTPAVADIARTVQMKTKPILNHIWKRKAKWDEMYFSGIHNA